MALGKFSTYILIHLTICSRGIYKNKMSTTSGNINNDNTHSSFKMTSPVLTKEHVYSDWKYYLIVWEVLTSLQKNKQGLVVFLSFTVQDK